MAIVAYLAMTAAEIVLGGAACPHIAWMTPYDCGEWTELPENLPVGTLLAVNDAVPMDGQDVSSLCDTLSRVIFRLGCKGVLLDFQRPGSQEARMLAEKLPDALPCPVAVSDLYAKGLTCPVFLSPLPLDRRLGDHIAPWTGREIWLDVSAEAGKILLTREGCTDSPLFHFTPPQHGHREENLHCHYTISLTETAAAFTLWRTREDLLDLLQEAEALGISKAIGLYQELNGIV